MRPRRSRSIASVAPQLKRALETALVVVDDDDLARACTERAVKTAASPIGPAPTIADRVARLDPAGEYADLVRLVGRMSARNSTCSSRELRRHLVGRRVGERDAGVLGLHAVDDVAEDPAAAAGAEAVAAARGSTLQRPQAVMHDARTRSPSVEVVTASPISTTVPTASWPRIVPGSTSGTSPLRMCRSVPQMVTASTRITTSVGPSIPASGTSSTYPEPLDRDTPPGPSLQPPFRSPEAFARRGGRHPEAHRSSCGNPVGRGAREPRLSAG